MPDLAVIIPLFGEIPHLHYTLQSLWNELSGYVDFEVILIENSKRDLDILKGPVSVKTDKGLSGEAIRSLRMMTKDQDTSWFKILKYKDKLSHWNCKNLAVRNTEAEFLFFIDAHCLVSPGTLRAAYWTYVIRDNIDGSLHLPISDFLKADYRKIYKLLCDPEFGLLHYENMRWEIETSTPGPGGPVVKRPVMSTCGMLVRREHITDDIEFWPEELGSYGGGENYYNFTMALLGKSIHVMNCDPIWHWHIPGQWSRDYMPTYGEWARNIMVATYLVAGCDWLNRLVYNRSKLPDWHPVKCANLGDITLALDAIVASESLSLRRERIKAKAVITIEEWAEQWK